jgi:formylmethanofuran dehydrogenase subunit E
MIRYKSDGTIENLGRAYSGGSCAPYRKEQIFRDDLARKKSFEKKMSKTEWCKRCGGPISKKTVKIAKFRNEDILCFKCYQRQQYHRRP